HFFGGSEQATSSSHQSCGLFMGCNPDSIQTPVQDCRSEYTTGIAVRYGQHVNGVGLICDARALPAAAPAPAPVKPIKSTRRGGSATSAPATASGPGVAPRMSINGLWDFSASDRDTLRVQIVAQGNGLSPVNQADIMPMQVNGIISGGDDALAG